MANDHDAVGKDKHGKVMLLHQTFQKLNNVTIEHFLHILKIKIKYLSKLVETKAHSLQ